MNDYLTISDNTHDIVMVGKEQTTDVSAVKSTVPTAFMTEIAVIITAIAAAIAAYICFLMLSVMAVANPVGLVIAMIGLLGGSVTIAIKGPEAIEKLFIEKTAPKIKEKLQEQDFSSKIEDMIHSEIYRILMTYSQTLTIDENKFRSDKDLAIQTPEDSIEYNCFSAIGNIKALNDNLLSYEKFINNYIKHEKD